MGFSGEQYIFTFTNDATHYTKTYTGIRKSNWLKCLQAFHSLCKTRSKQEHPIERLCSDYGLELQSHKTDERLQKQGIIFKPSAPYSQEQNRVSERTSKTLIDMIHASMLEGNNDNDLWPEILLAMTYIKNNRLTEPLTNNITPQEAQNQEAPNLSHLHILGSTVYVFLYEEKRSKKSEK